MLVVGVSCVGLLGALSWAVSRQDHMLSRDGVVVGGGGVGAKCWRWRFGLFGLSFVPYVVLIGSGERCVAAGLELAFYVPMHIRLGELLLELAYEKDESFVERVLHLAIPPEDVERIVKCQDLQTWRKIVQEYAFRLLEVGGWLFCSDRLLIQMVCIRHDDRFILAMLSCISSFLFGLRSFAMISVNSVCIQLVLLVLHDDIVMPGMMDKPYVAMTLREFWVRWNRPIYLILKRHIYLPILYHFGPKHTMLARNLAFLCSAFYHALYLWAAGANWFDLWLVCAFFIAQSCLIGFETCCNLHGHLWVCVTMFVTLPLFAKPHFHVGII